MTVACRSLAGLSSPFSSAMVYIRGCDWDPATSSLSIWTPLPASAPPIAPSACMRLSLPMSDTSTLYGCCSDSESCGGFSVSASPSSSASPLAPFSVLESTSSSYCSEPSPSPNLPVLALSSSSFASSPAFSSSGLGPSSSFASSGFGFSSGLVSSYCAPASLGVFTTSILVPVTLRFLLYARFGTPALLVVPWLPFPAPPCLVSCASIILTYCLTLPSMCLTCACPYMPLHCRTVPHS